MTFVDTTELSGHMPPYDADTTETDIEHMVARSEAHDSGLCSADLATRRRFASDLLNLPKPPQPTHTCFQESQMIWVQSPRHPRLRSARWLPA